MNVDISKFEKLTPSQWEEKIFYRAVNVKYPQQLKELLDMYPAKIARLNEQWKMPIPNLTLDMDRELREAQIDEWQNYLNEKIKRLNEKLAVCTKMLSLRESKSVSDKKEWEMHGTTYYIDFVGGDDGNDGLSTGTAWKTINKYTTTTVRTAGDIAKLRANVTWLPTADIRMDEDGTVNSYIELRGCSVADDPWGDGSNVKPIINFGDQEYQILLSGDEYWKLNNLDIIQSTDTAGNVYIVGNSFGAYFLNCIIRDNGAASTQYGIYANATHNIKIENCQFLDNLFVNLYLLRITGTIDGCTFNGGITGTVYGLRADSSILMAKSCTFGQTTMHTTEDIYALNTSFIHTINCKRNKSTYSATIGAVVFAEDDNQVKGNNITYFWNGTVEKKTDVVRTGGALSSALMLPNSSCGLYAPLCLTPFNQHDFDDIYCTAVETTITIYIRANEAWSVYPTADELYLEASYLSHATLATRTLIQSSSLIEDTSDWSSGTGQKWKLTVTFTPLQAGFAYLKIYLKKYESGKGVYVDFQITKT